jgi:heat shock protein HslJ
VIAVLAVLAALALVVTGSWVVGATPMSADIGGTWTVVRVGDQPAVPMHEPRLQFTDSDTVLRGTSSCRDLEMRVRVERNSLRFDKVVAPVVPGCPPAAIRFDDLFLAALEAVEKYKISQGRMSLTGRGTEILAETGELQLTDAELELAAALEDRSWRLVDVTGAAQGGSLLRIEFISGRVVASGECGFAGRYRLRGEDLIQFYDMIMGEVGCLPAVARESLGLVAMLEGTTRLALEPARSALLLDGEGHRITLSAESSD